MTSRFDGNSPSVNMKQNHFVEKCTFALQIVQSHQSQQIELFLEAVYIFEKHELNCFGMG